MAVNFPLNNFHDMNEETFKELIKLLDNAEYNLPVAAADTLGGVKIGDNISVTEDGTISTHAAYSLPTAAADTLGGVKVGDGLSINDGVLSVTKHAFTATEQEIGTYLTDPLYEITAAVTVPAAGTLANVVALPANCNQVVSLDGYVTISGTTYPLNFAAGTDVTLYTGVNATHIEMLSGSDIAGATGYVTIKYSKTT